MTHHVHLLLTPKEAATVPKLVISLGRRYVRYFNRRYRRYRRTSTLWDSRLDSVLNAIELTLPIRARHLGARRILIEPAD